MIRFRHWCGMAVIAAVCAASQPQPVVAQLDFIRGLLGGRAEPRQPNFRGHQQLAQATEQAENGDVKASLKLVREAFKEGGAKEPFNDPDSQSIAPTLLRLSKLWTEKNAPPNEVAEVLREIVLPAKPVGDVLPYLSQWQLSYDSYLLSRSNSRLPMPESVAAELVRWTVLAKQSEALKERLKASLESAKRGPLARVIGAQLAVAEQDIPTAKRHFAALTDDAKKATDVTNLEFLCHAVFSSGRSAEVDAPRLSLLEAILDQAEGKLTPDSGLRGNAPWLRIQIAQQHARAGRADAALRVVNAALSKPLSNQRNGAEYNLYLSRSRLQQGAAVLLDVGRVSEALDLLAPISEGPEPRSVAYWDRPNIAAMLARELQKLPAGARFEVLRQWVLPQKDRAALRDITDFVPLDLPTIPSVTTNDKPLPSAGLLNDTYSVGWHLLVTARELGKLDVVLQDLAVVPEQTFEVEVLRTLGAVLRDGSTDAKSVPAARTVDTTARLQNLVAATAQKIPQWQDTNKTPFPMLTLVVAVEAARHPEWRDVAQSLLERLVDHSQKIQWDRPRAHVRLALMEVMRLRGIGNSQTTSFSEWSKLQPKHWVWTGIQTAAQHASGSLPVVWCALDGYVQHITGSYESEISFEYPLSGRFELSFDCREGNWSEGNAGLGGAQFHIHGYTDNASLMGKGRSGYESGPGLKNLLHKEPWNHYLIQVDGDVVRYLANGQLVHEDKPGVSAPWLTLGADWGRTALFRNFRLKGTPTIPREIQLLTNARLRGWVASHFEESRPDALREPRRYVTQLIEENGQRAAFTVEADESNIDQASPAVEPETDWKFQDGELRSARRDIWNGSTESWLYYQRPLRDGETLRYEFFQQSGQTEAAPTIGRVAYQFSGDGITRHWITDGPSDVMLTLPNNGALEKKKLALKDNEWNQVEVTLAGEQLTIALNGKAVVTEKISLQDDLKFGFFHETSTSLRVRNAVLSGSWPKEFNDQHRAAIEWPQPIEELSNSRFFSYAFSEDRISDNAYEIYRRAVTLEGQQRYEFLRRWILPNSTHDLLRMAGAFTPTHPAPPMLNEHPIDVATMEARQAIDRRFVQAGGNFVCPAILLVLAAAEIDRMDELEAEILKHPPTSSLEMARNRSAILGIIALLKDEPEEALAWIWDCSRLIPEKETLPQYGRWGDAALASLAIQHPVTRDAAYELIDRIQRKQLQAGSPGNSDYGRFMRQLHGQVHYLMHGGVPEEFGTQPRTKQWRMVPQPSAKSRGEGYPIASIDSFTGELAIRGGHDCDMAYFQSPLRGNYEVSCRLSQIGYREAFLMAAGIASGLRYTQTEARVLHVRSKIVESKIPMPISPKATNGFDFKIVVKDGYFTSYVNGQKLYESDLSEQPDPWLAWMGLAGNSSRFARNIVITGKPEIPSELDLLASNDLKGWMTDYYGNAVAQSPFVWTLQDGILASEQTPTSGSGPGKLKIENIVRYHRPMLEDGEVEYEFFYDPDMKVTLDDPNQQVFIGGVVRNAQRTVKGQSLVHPALDRMVCMLQPDGVKIHWLTDGRFDRTGLTAGNLSTPISADTSANIAKPANKLPLKPREWNALKFATSGDTLKIELNGQLVFSHPIEPTNLRHFGLFHYANESNVRVRNIRYRGEWPRTLPSVDQQELATGPERLTDTPDADLPETASWDFTGSKFKAEDFGYHWDAKAAAKFIRPTADGLHFALPAGEAKTQWAGLHTKLRLSGDFNVTIEYEGLKTTPAKESWGTGMSFVVQLDQSYEAGVVAREQGGSKSTRGFWLVTSPLKEYLYKEELIPGFVESGRMRLQRRGPVIYYSLAPKGSDEFRLVTHRPVGTNDVKLIKIQADASDAVGGAEFILKSLTVQAAKIIKVK